MTVLLLLLLLLLLLFSAIPVNTRDKDISDSFTDTAALPNTQTGKLKVHLFMDAIVAAVTRQTLGRWVSCTYGRAIFSVAMFLMKHPLHMQSPLGE